MMRRYLKRFRRNVRGMALVEFAMVLPVLMTISLAGAELANYIVVKMRVSQLALWIADNAARMASNSSYVPKPVTEGDINDLFAGAQLQSQALDLNTNGRVVLSSLEPKNNPNTTNEYVIAWQRCMGQKPNPTPGYGTVGPAPAGGMGPPGRKVTAQDYNATMFVEVFYTYKPLVPVPLVLTKYLPSGSFDEIASMTVRDRRDFAAKVKAGGTSATC